MKRILSVLASVCCCLVFGLALAGCGKVAVEAEEVKLDQDEITLSSGASTELAYTVTPEDGRVEFEIVSEKKASERVFTYAVENGTVTIQAKSAGTETLRIRAKSDDTVYADCKVTVELPSGYAAFRKSDVKMVYPSAWTKYPMTGMEMMYMQGSSNIALTSEKKNTAILSATADTFKATVENTYKALGISITDLKCTVEKYDDDKAVRVDYKYVLAGVQTSQVQLIRNSESKTYILTLTNATKKQIQTIQNEFYAW
ncbi:MAG: hypothetical protein K2J30_03840 [Clostridia bacterium]|nr:hypothetical protein [Clostridia bacterium]